MTLAFSLGTKLLWPNGECNASLALTVAWRAWPCCILSLPRGLSLVLSLVSFSQCSRPRAALDTGSILSLAAEPQGLETLRAASVLRGAKRQSSEAVSHHGNIIRLAALLADAPAFALDQPHQQHSLYTLLCFPRPQLDLSHDHASPTTSPAMR